MSDLISRQDAIDAIESAKTARTPDGEIYVAKLNAEMNIQRLPSAEPEQAKYVPDTKAIPSSRDCVELSERVTAIFYDDEHEEWSQKTVTIQDVLDSVCDEYTVLPSAQPERKTGRWIPVDSFSAYGGDEGTWMAHGNPIAFHYCSNCKEQAYADEDGEDILSRYCPHCGARLIYE